LEQVELVAFKLGAGGVLDGGGGGGRNRRWWGRWNAWTNERTLLIGVLEVAVLRDIQLNTITTGGMGGDGYIVLTISNY
jgi:hypothetical protein